MAYKPPYFLLYVNDMLGSAEVDLMDAEQFGWYLKLLMRSWQAETPCHLPNDTEKLRSLLRIGRREKEIAVFAERFSIVFERFSITDDGKFIFHPKLVEQYRDLLERHEKQVAGGKSTRLALGKLPAKQEVSRGFPDPIPEPLPTKTKSFSATAPKKATRLPDDFAVTDGHRKFSADRGYPNPDVEVENFVNYWTAAAGSSSRKMDWNAAFRLWLAKAEKYGARNGIDKAQQRQQGTVKGARALISSYQGMASGGVSEPCDSVGPSTESRTIEGIRRNSK